MTKLKDNQAQDSNRCGSKVQLPLIEIQMIGRAFCFFSSESRNACFSPTDCSTNSVLLAKAVRYALEFPESMFPRICNADASTCLYLLTMVVKSKIS